MRSSEGSKYPLSFSLCLAYTLLTYKYTFFLSNILVCYAPIFKINNILTYAFGSIFGVQHLSSKILLRWLNKYVNAKIYCYPRQLVFAYLFVTECAFMCIHFGALRFWLSFSLSVSLTLVWLHSFWCGTSSLLTPNTELNCMGIKLLNQKNKWFLGIWLSIFRNVELWTPIATVPTFSNLFVRFVSDAS